MESYHIRKLSDGTWVLSINGDEDSTEFAYDTPKDLLASLSDEMGSEKKEDKKEKSKFKKMVEEEDEDE